MLNEDNSTSREDAPTWLDLYDYRRRVATLYNERERSLIGGEEEQGVLERFRAGRDALFANHPQSALNAEQRRVFVGLHYFPYNPNMRVQATMKPLPPTEKAIEAADGPHTLTLKPAASVEFTIDDSAQRLTVYWIDVYGGGLFLPFRDMTCPEESYGGGRYLFDTVKGSNFLGVRENDELFGIASSTAQGYVGGEIILDFNYAYNPSCAYDSRWVCPLAPVENRLKVRIEAGEKKFAED
ncbi:MAG: DUF1684 domain-containing protein [Chloroflexia bacterium]